MLHHAGKGVVHHQTVPGWLGEVALRGIYHALSWMCSYAVCPIPHMNGLTHSSTHFFFKLFSGCPKQLEWEFIRENDISQVPSSPIPVPVEEYQSAPDVYPGEL